MLEPKQMEDISAWIGRLLESNREKIWGAYLKTDGGITVSVVLKIFPSRKIGEICVDGMLKFTESRIKEKFSLNFNAFMEPLFKDDVSKLKKGLRTGESLTITGGRKSVTLKGQ